MNKLEIDDYVDDNYELPEDNDDYEQEEENEEAAYNKGSFQGQIGSNNGQFNESPVYVKDFNEKGVRKIVTANSTKNGGTNGLTDFNQDPSGYGREPMNKGIGMYNPIQQQQINQMGQQQIRQGQGFNNVYQHFNQPQVVNYTQNQYYQPPPTYQNQGVTFQANSTIQSGALPPMMKQESGKKKGVRPISAVPLRRDSSPKGSVNLANIPPNIQKQVFSTNDFMNSTYRKKIIPSNMMYNKEDLYDQNIAVKIQLNEYKEHSIRLRTRLTQLISQLRGRDKLIDDLYKSAFITASGTQAKSNLNKDVLLMINLKRQVQDLKDTIFANNTEILDLKKQIKSTKIRELETEIKMYMKECVRLRSIAEHSVRMSGEIDLKHMQRQMQEQQHQFSLQAQQYQSEVDRAKQEIEKLCNQLSQAQIDISQQGQKIDQYEMKIQQLQKEIESIQSDRKKKIEEKDRELAHRQEQIFDRDNQITKYKATIEQHLQRIKEVEKLIPKRPEKEYIEDLEQKSDKIEQLLDELLQKDTLIDKQAVLNKSIQKKFDASQADLGEANKKMEQLQLDLKNEEQVTKNKKGEIQDMQQRHSEELRKLKEEAEKECKHLKDEIEQLIERHRQHNTIKIVKRDHPAVVEGFERLKRLCQIKGASHDQIENVLFDNYRPEAKITIVALKIILEKQLMMQDQSSLYFCRYLVEPIEDEVIEYQEGRTVAAAKIVVRLMSQIGDYKIYNNQSIINSLEAFGSYELSQDKVDSTLSMYEDEVTFKQFKLIVGKALKMDLECDSLDCSFVTILSKQGQTVLKLNTQHISIFFKDATIAMKTKKMQDQDLKLKVQKQIEDKKQKAYEDEMKAKENEQKEESESDDEDDDRKEDRVETVEDAINLIQQILKIRTEEGRETDASPEETSLIIEQTELILKDVGQTLANKKLNLRKALKGKIYTEINPQAFDEVEVITTTDFLGIISDFSSLTFEEEEIDILKSVFKSLLLEGFVKFEELNSVLKCFGVQEDLPKSKKHLQYEILDVKSKRILNRFVFYLQKTQISLDEFLDGMQINQSVKTKTKTEKVQIIKADLFFQRLYEVGIRKSGIIYQNLVKFLCIDETYINCIMQKKLVRAIQDFSKSETLKSIGARKIKRVPFKIGQTETFDTRQQQSEREENLAQKITYNENVKQQKELMRDIDFEEKMDAVAQRLEEDDKMRTNNHLKINEDEDDKEDSQFERESKSSVQKESVRSFQQHPKIDSDQKPSQRENNFEPPSEYTEQEVEEEEVYGTEEDPQNYGVHAQAQGPQQQFADGVKTSQKQVQQHQEEIHNTDELMQKLEHSQKPIMQEAGVVDPYNVVQKQASSEEEEEDEEYEDDDDEF